MACNITYGERLAKAMALDAEAGTEHRGDSVICEMLQHVGPNRTCTLAKPAAANGSHAPRTRGGQGVGSHKDKKASVQLLAKSRIAATPADPKKPQAQRRPWAPVQVAAALDDGVKRGRISGSTAVAAMKAFQKKQ